MLYMLFLKVMSEKYHYLKIISFPPRLFYANVIFKRIIYCLERWGGGGKSFCTWSESATQFLRIILNSTKVFSG